MHRSPATTAGHPSLYHLCQTLMEREWDINESTADWSCICGFKYHTLSYAGTPILYKKGDRLEIKIERIGLMPRDWIPEQGVLKWQVLAAAINALGGEVK